MNKVWGYLRETAEKAKKDGIDPETKIKRTGLDEYLDFIFPNVKDWIHDKIISGSNSKKRPDYRSETLKMIVEFDGLPHYANPIVIKNDLDNTKFYENLGYKVVRIPFFIQLSNKAVEELFDVKIQDDLFDETVPSLSVKAKNTPAFLCNAGIERMAQEFKRFPNQYKANLEYLKKINDDFLTGISFLEKAYNS